MQFSRAIAFACFTVTKWLMLILCVLFAALTMQSLFEDVPQNPVSIYIMSSVAALAIAGLMHWLATRISG